MTETFLKVEQPAAPENPTVKVRNVATVVGSNTVLHQVTMSAKEDGTIIPPASETKQDTGNASLSSIDTKTPALGQALASGSVPSVLPQSQIDALTPPAAITGFSTSAKQDVLQAAVGTTSDAEAASGDGTLVAILKACRTKLSSIVTAVTGTLTVGLPTGAATAAKQPALGTAGSASTDVLTVQGIASGVAQPVSAASLPLPSGASTLAEQQSQTTAVGSLTETAPASDTASSGLNGRLQRIAQRITSLIALLPTSLAAGGGLKVEGVAGGVAQPMSGTVKTSLSASSAVTISLASLASDTNLLAGRESSAIDNTTTRALDYLLAGKIRQGTTPTTAKEIRVYVVGTLTEAPSWPDVFDGTDSAETVTSSGIRDSVCRLAAVMATDSTSDRDNFFGPVSVAALFGGVLPAQFVVFVTHNTAVNLNSTGGNHVLSITPVFQTIS